MQTVIESNLTSQIATFHVENLLLGVDINAVQEINRHVDVTEVPHSPQAVRGVINLRGEVVTVLDLRALLALPRRDITKDSRCVVIHSEGELIGVLVDRIADIISVRDDEMDWPPANLDGVEGRFFRGVHTLESGVVVLLDVEQLLEPCS